MPEADEISQQIVIGKSFRPAKAPTEVDRFMSWLAQRKIKTFEPQKLRDEHAFPEVLAQISVLTDVELQNVENSLPVLARQFSDFDEQLVRMSVSVELNQSSALVFAQALRGRVKDLITTREIDYDNEWFTGEELTRLAERWYLPVVIFPHGAHFRLALREPEHTAQGWRVLVYDPMRNNEQWLQLEGWNTDYSKPYSNLEHASINTLGLEALQQGTYNFSLIGDMELANPVMAAKQARVQYNVIDCGPLTLYAASLREGVKPGWNQFKFTGRDVLERDTGLKIQTREEILGR